MHVVILGYSYVWQSTAVAFHMALPIKTLYFGELYQEDFSREKEKKDKSFKISSWSKRKTGTDSLHESTHHQENSNQYLEGLGDKEDI